jgi:hypothetical protein
VECRRVGVLYPHFTMLRFCRKPFCKISRLRIRRFVWKVSAVKQGHRYPYAVDERMFRTVVPLTIPVAGKTGDKLRVTILDVL